MINVSKYTWGIAVSIEVGHLLSAFCVFDKDDTRPLELRRGDGVAVQGQISRAYSRSVSLENCELIGVITVEEIAARIRAEQKPTTAPIAAEPSAAVEKPRLPDAALQLWYQAFKRAYPNGSQTLAMKSAIGAFPDHHVARSRIRELFPNSPRGRPKKINDLDNSLESDGE